MTVRGASVAYCVGGSLILYSGIKGATIADTVKAVLHGNLKVTETQGIVPPDNPASIGNAVASSSSIVDDAMQYNGNRYVWGGIPGTVKGKNNGTDCSGFVNMVVGRDLGLPIPGYTAGAYNGSVHGPTSQIWLLWNGATTISRSQAQPGDLACFITHMGIFTDNGQHFISALDTKDGVLVTTVADGSPANEPLHVRRLVDG